MSFELLALAFLVLSAAGSVANSVFERTSRNGVAASVAAARVIDGDTISVAGERIRLANADAPEISSPKCDSEYERGQQARRFTERALRGGQVTVERMARQDEFGRTIAWVRIDGRDLGEMLIEAGLARPWMGLRRSWC